MTGSFTRPVETNVLTLAKLRIYQAYGGDLDAWARRGHDGSMTDEDWHLIERLRQDLYLVGSGQAAPELCEATERRLQSATDSEETRKILRELAQRRPV